MTTRSIRVILASESPRRRELLTLIGIEHTVSPSRIDESIVGDEDPCAHVERLAREKARVVAANASKVSDPSDTLVIAADTVVVIDGRIIGKPASAAAAEDTLRLLSGRTHTVVTGMACVLNGRTESAVEDVDVTFRELTDDEIRDYVSTGEPLDKAGSYGIQGYGAAIVRRIDGDFFAVMGLSIVRLMQLMEKLGVRYRFGRAPLSHT